MLMPENTAVSVNSRAPQAHRHRADQPRIIGPAEPRHHEREQQPGEAVAHDEVEQHEDREERDDDEGVVDGHQHAVHGAAGIAREHADDERQAAADHRHRDAEQQRVADRRGELPEHVLPARIGAHPIGPGGRHVGRHDVAVHRADRARRRRATRSRPRSRAGSRRRRRRGWSAQQAEEHCEHRSVRLHARDRAADRAGRSAARRRRPRRWKPT